MKKENFVEDFYEEYGFYPPKSVNSWEEWDESQNKASQPKEEDNQLIINN